MQGYLLYLLYLYAVFTMFGISKVFPMFQYDVTILLPRVYHGSCFTSISVGSLVQSVATTPTNELLISIIFC